MHLNILKTAGVSLLTAQCKEERKPTQTHKTNGRWPCVPRQAEVLENLIASSWTALKSEQRLPSMLRHNSKLNSVYSEFHLNAFLIKSHNNESHWCSSSNKQRVKENAAAIPGASRRAPWALTEATVLPSSIMWIRLVASLDDNVIFKPYFGSKCANLWMGFYQIWPAFLYTQLECIAAVTTEIEFMALVPHLSADFKITIWILSKITA